VSDLPFSPACERNREPILAVLREVFSSASQVLEIGSGTGQHAVYFSDALPDVTWHTSDVVDNHPGIAAWIAEHGAQNVVAPLALDVTMRPWPVPEGIDAAFSANTAHIMAWHEVCAMFAGLGSLLPSGAPFCLYGPFNINGEFTSASNREFNNSLRLRDPRMGIRDLRELKLLAADCGFTLDADHALPANNMLLVWRRGSD